MDGSLETWWIFLATLLTCCGKWRGLLTSLYLKYPICETGLVLLPYKALWDLRDYYHYIQCKANSSKQTVLQTTRTIPTQGSVTDFEKNLGYLNVFSSFPVHPRKKRKERERKKKALQRASPLAQSIEILKHAVQHGYSSQARERSKLQLHQLFFTIS